MADSTICMSAANEVGFQRRVKYFMTKAAAAILGEDPLTENHAERVVYANKILDGTASVYEFAVAVATNSTIAANLVAGTEPSDSDMEFTVNSFIDDFAGAD
jgi:hypothetical protein